MTTKNIAIVYGGFSGERVISEKSAHLVQKHLDIEKYNSYLIDIDHHAWTAWFNGNSYPVSKDDFSVIIEGEKINFDGVFNAVHGTPGEDGKLQGYFDVINMPYNNCDVLSSAMSFNKLTCNLFLAGAGIKVAKSHLVRLGHEYDKKAIIKKLGLPCFVKPCDGGSSIGVTKVKKEEDFDEAIRYAQEEGVDALIESFLDGMEVSCGCININVQAKAVAVTEIVPANEFFDYESKYTADGTQEITPARLPKERYDEVMRLTEVIYLYLNCKGMIRVDFMVCDDATYMIEPNTTPGLSDASILPQQAIYAGYDLETFFDISLSEMFVDHSKVDKN